MKKLGYVLALGCLLTAIGTANAGVTVNYSTDPFNITDIGRDPAYSGDWDHLHGSGVSEGSADVPTNGDAVLALIDTSVSFQTGLNRWNAVSGTGEVSRMMTVTMTGEFEPLIQTYTYTISYTDSLFLLEGSTTYFDLGTYGLAVTPQPLSFTNDGTLPMYAEFRIVSSSSPSEPVPEPLTMASAFFAIAGLGGYIRRRTGRAAA